MEIGSKVSVFNCIFHFRHMKQNLVVLLADMFNLFEIHPAQCVEYPESETASGKSKKVFSSITPTFTLYLLWICLSNRFVKTL
jgi:hypothetical protein